jgi:hypothetical protein
MYIYIIVIYISYYYISYIYDFILLNKDDKVLEYILTFIYIYLYRDRECDLYI